MVKKSIALTGLSIAFLLQPLLASPRAKADLPDLIIRQYEFVSDSDKRLRVRIANEGKAESSPCRLELAVRKLNGAAVTRTASETIPALRPGKEERVVLNATGILPAAVSLKDTTFKLVVDETNLVAESDEGNNETWHNSN